MDGATRVQRNAGYSNSWSQLDRVFVRAPEADVSDAQPSARPIYESRLIQGEVSDHIPFRWTTVGDKEGRTKAFKIPRWAATDPEFRSLFDLELKAAIKLQENDPFKTN